MAKRARAARSRRCDWLDQPQALRSAVSSLHVVNAGDYPAGWFAPRRSARSRPSRHPEHRTLCANKSARASASAVAARRWRPDRRRARNVRTARGIVRCDAAALRFATAPWSKRLTRRATDHVTPPRDSRVDRTGTARQLEAHAIAVVELPRSCGHDPNVQIRACAERMKQQKNPAARARRNGGAGTEKRPGRYTNWL